MAHLAHLAQVRRWLAARSAQRDQSRSAARRALLLVAVASGGSIRRSEPRAPTHPDARRVPNKHDSAGTLAALAGLARMPRFPASRGRDQGQGGKRPTYGQARQSRRAKGKHAGKQALHSDRKRIFCASARLHAAACPPPLPSYVTRHPWPPTAPPHPSVATHPPHPLCNRQAACHLPPATGLRPHARSAQRTAQAQPKAGRRAGRTGRGGRSAP